MAHWEYHTLKFEASGWFLGGKLDLPPFQAALNNLGKEGWELVNVFETNMHQGQTRDIVAVFKRPLSQ